MSHNPSTHLSNLGLIRRLQSSQALALGLSLAVLWLFSSALPVARAAGPWYVDPAGSDTSSCTASGAAAACKTIRATIATSEPNNEYFTARTITLSDGTSLDEYVINGPPKPPPGYELERAAVALPEPNQPMVIKTLTVPAFDWVFGCSSVSGAMIAGYYDRNGFPNMYTGPTNGGIMPLDNSSWPTWSDGYTTYPNLPLAASHQGVDGRTTRGSIDDYWVAYASSASGPIHHKRLDRAHLGGGDW